MTYPIHTYIHIHTYNTHTHFYVHTVMDPYTHILLPYVYLWLSIHIRLPLTFNCQTTFISGSSETKNCVCPFLDYIECTTMSDEVPVLYWSIVIHIYTGIHIHIRDRNSQIHLLCSDSCSYTKKKFEFELQSCYSGFTSFRPTFLRELLYSY